MAKTNFRKNKLERRAEGRSIFATKTRYSNNNFHYTDAWIVSYHEKIRQFNNEGIPDHFFCFKRLDNRPNYEYTFAHINKDGEEDELEVSFCCYEDAFCKYNIHSIDDYGNFMSLLFENKLTDELKKYIIK